MTGKAWSESSGCGQREGKEAGMGKGELGAALWKAGKHPQEIQGTAGKDVCVAQNPLWVGPTKNPQRTLCVQTPLFVGPLLQGWSSSGDTTGVEKKGKERSREGTDMRGNDKKQDSFLPLFALHGIQEMPCAHPR